MKEVNERFLKEEVITKEADEFDLVDSLRVLQKWKGLIIGGTLLGMIIAVATSLMMPKVYKASAVLFISNPKIEGIGGSVKLPSIETYVGIIKSQALATGVIEKLGLDKPPDQLRPENFISKMISVEPIRNTNLIRISIEYTDPEKARDIVNTSAALAVDLNQTLNESEAVSYRDFLKAELDTMELTLKQAEQELLAFKETAEIDKLKKEIEILLEEKGNLERGVLAGERGLIEQGLLGVDRAIEEKNAMIDTLAKKLTGEKKILELSKSISNDSVMKDVVKEASNLSALDLLGLQIKEEQVNPLHEKLEPKLVEALSDLEGLKAKKTALVRDLEANGGRLTNLQKELAQKEVKLESLTRTYDLAKEIYISLKRRFEEARIQIAAKTQELKVVDPAITPRNPSKPNIKLNAFLAGAAGFISLTLLVFLLEYSSRKKIETSVKPYLNN